MYSRPECAVQPLFGRGATRPFGETIAGYGLSLRREKTTTLQINVGLVCNLCCSHCHLCAGPDRREMMTAETLDQVLAYAAKNPFETIDITGGSPELHMQIREMIERFTPLATRVLLRTNLTALQGEAWDRLTGLCRERGVVLIASLPSLKPRQMDAQRGEGVFHRTISSLRQLNAIGYGMPGAGLELDLVSNPPGAFLPESEAQAEKRFRDLLNKQWGISFHHLYPFANVPLGRFHRWLEQTGNLDGYLKKLTDRFSPGSVSSLMCRSLLSVDWEGYLHDCDFNLARGLDLGGVRTHVSEMEGAPIDGSAIATDNHCYACTAGSGFT
jgi:radical SAM/Cys-rich protein